MWRVVVLFVALTILVANAAPLNEKPGLCQQGSKPLETQANLELAVSHVTGKYNYSCPECRAMVSALQTQCHISGADDDNKGFSKRCFDTAIPVAKNGTFLNGKCHGFLEFCKEIYCPLDPCVQITTMRNEAPDAVCHLLKCHQVEQPEIQVTSNKTKPRTCPTYVKRISEACRLKKAREANPTHPRPHRQSRNAMIAAFEAEACGAYIPSFEREGCGMVLEMVGVAEALGDPCSSLLCDKALDHAAYCALTLNMSATTPVPEPGYVSWLQGVPTDRNVTKCDKASIQGWGMRIVNASFGQHCFVNATNNILKSLRERCQGKIECTYGNQDLPHRRSDFTGLVSTNTTDCSNKFEIHYRCHPSLGETVTIDNDSQSAKFQAIPFSCVPQLSVEQRERYQEVKRHLANAIGGRN